MEDIMDKPYIPYQKSNRFPKLSKEQRAMQFAPFSVLEGYKEKTQEVQREYESKFEVRVDESEEYDKSLEML